MRCAARVAAEIRIFPLLGLGSIPSRHLQPVIDALGGMEVSSEIAPVRYEFQKGGNRMLVINQHGAMVCIPRAHRETILDIQDEEIESLYRLAKRMVRGAEIAFGAIAANVFQNNGAKDGQHEPHMHVHVVPRYESSDADVVFLQRNFTVAPVERLEQVGPRRREPRSRVINGGHEAH